MFFLPNLLDHELRRGNLVLDVFLMGDSCGESLVFSAGYRKEKNLLNMRRIWKQQICMTSYSYIEHLSNHSTLYDINNWTWNTSYPSEMDVYQLHHWLEEEAPHWYTGPFCFYLIGVVVMPRASIKRLLPTKAPKVN